jgi:hypothetical protein
MGVKVVDGISLTEIEKIPATLHHKISSLRNFLKESSFSNAVFATSAFLIILAHTSVLFYSSLIEELISAFKNESLSKIILFSGSFIFLEMAISFAENVAEHLKNKEVVKATRHLTVQSMDHLLNTSYQRFGELSHNGNVSGTLFEICFCLDGFVSTLLRMLVSFSCLFVSILFAIQASLFLLLPLLFSGFLFYILYAFCNTKEKKTPR